MHIMKTVLYDEKYWGGKESREREPASRELEGWGSSELFKEHNQENPHRETDRSAKTSRAREARLTDIWEKKHPGENSLSKNVPSMLERAELGKDVQRPWQRVGGGATCGRPFKQGLGLLLCVIWEEIRRCWPAVEQITPSGVGRGGKPGRGGGNMQAGGGKPWTRASEGQVIKSDQALDPFEGQHGRAWSQISLGWGKAEESKDQPQVFIFMTRRKGVSFIKIENGAGRQGS